MSYLHFTVLWSQGQECQSIRILPAFWKSFSAATACGQQIADISSKAKSGWKFCHHVVEACRDARMVLSAHCFLARLIHPKDSNQFFMKLPFQIFKPFDSAPSANICEVTIQQASELKGQHTSAMGILQLAPAKQLGETSDQKWSNIFKVCAVLLPVQLCCMPANASRFWKHERYLRKGLMISLFRAIKTWGYMEIWNKNHHTSSLSQPKCPDPHSANAALDLGSSFTHGNSVTCTETRGRTNAIWVHTTRYLRKSDMSWDVSCLNANVASACCSNIRSTVSATSFKDMQIKHELCVLAKLALHSWASQYAWMYEQL